MVRGGVVVKVHDRQFARLLRQATAEGIQRAGVFYHAKCREAVSTPNTGTRIKGGRDNQGRFLKGRTVYDNPSRPGEPPRLRTGQGRDEIVMEFNDNEKAPEVRVGVSAKGIYMIFLELGTRLIQPRPWLLDTLMKFREQIGRLAATGAKKRG